MKKSGIHGQIPSGFKSLPADSSIEIGTLATQTTLHASRSGRRRKESIVRHVLGNKIKSSLFLKIGYYIRTMTTI